MFTSHGITQRAVVVVLIVALGAGAVWLCRGEAAPPEVPAKASKMACKEPVKTEPNQPFDPTKKEPTYDELKKEVERLREENKRLKKSLEDALEGRHAPDILRMREVMNRVAFERWLKDREKAQGELAQEKEKHKK